MVYSNERMKNISIFDRLIFLTFLITNPKVSCRIQPMLANKIEERANGYLIRAVPFRKAAKSPIRFDIAVSGMEAADPMK